MAARRDAALEAEAKAETEEEGGKKKKGKKGGEITGGKCYR
jgi:hypothetical protein